MKAAIFLFATIFVAVINIAKCGECPTIPTVANFDNSKFLGSWYSIQESSDPRLPCLHYNVTQNEDGSAKCTFLPYNLEAIAHPKDPQDVTIGFKIEMKLQTMNGANWSIFATDYDNYAGIFTCKETDDVHYHSITLWSRTQTLSDNSINKMKGVLAQYNIDYSTLEKMVQGKFTCMAADTFVAPVMKLLTPLLLN